MDNAERHKSVMACHSPLAIASLGKSFEPMPTQVTPALNQAVRFSSVGSTAPVAMISDQGIGAFIFFHEGGAAHIARRENLAEVAARLLCETDL